MFGQPSFGGSSLFGASTTPSFGGATFGAPAASTTPSSAFPFGAPTPSTGIPSFGASTTPAFGGASTTTPSLFGAPAATSTTPSFGGSSLFGAPAATGGGLFGASSAPAAAATSTTGGFPFSFSGGATTQTAAPAAGSAFSFGGTPSASAFGATGTTGGAFGAAAPAAGTSTFGGMFGAPAGGGLGGAGGPAGTTLAPYAPVNDKDTTSNTTVTIHNISAMNQYKDKSFEELRWEDYQLGRKGAGMGSAGPAGGGMFGSAAPAASTTGGLFGAAPSAFTTTTTPTTGTSSLFGAPAASAGSLFGGGGATGSSLFGASTPASTGTSLFGGAPAASTGTNLFGATTSAPTTSTGLFGGTSAFGAPTGASATSSLFPSFSAQTSAPASSAFSFGGTTTSAAPATGGLFGATTTPSTSLFGGTTGGDASSSLFGGTSSSLFGGTTAGTGAAASSSLFGGTGSSLFGATTPATGGGLFGTTPASTGTTGGLFGGSSLFGGAPTTPSATSTFPSLGFGTSAPTTGGTGSSLFGTTTSTPLFSGLGTTLGGGSTLMGGPIGGVAPSLVATIDSPNPYGSLPPLHALSESDAALASAAAQTRTALKPKHYKITTRSPAAARPLGYYSNRVSFMGEAGQKEQPSPRPSTPEAFTRRKLILEPDDNVSMPEVAEFTPYAERNLAADKRDRGGMAPPATPYAGPAAEIDRKGTPETPQASVERDRERAATVPAIQITTPSGRSTEPPATPSSGLYPTLPSKEIASPAKPPASETPAAVTGRTPKKPIVERRHGQVLDYSGDKPETKRIVSNYDEFYRSVRDQDRKYVGAMTDEANLPTLTEPGYWMNPSLDTLRHYSQEELAHVTDLIVGRKGFGQIEFLDPVDVRGLDLNQLIVIDRHLVTVFPDDSKKPPRGQGLNVRARITIDEAWPERKDAKSIEEYEAFLRKKGSRRRQRFVAYDRQRGAWTFDVPGF